MFKDTITRVLVSAESWKQSHGRKVLILIEDVDGLNRTAHGRRNMQAVAARFDTRLACPRNCPKLRNLEGLLGLTGARQYPCFGLC